MHRETAGPRSVDDSAPYGPFDALMQAYLSDAPGPGCFMSGFMPNAILEGAAAPLKGLARIQLEMTGFAIRRAQAYTSFPSELAGCRTPSELVGVQVNFWRTAWEQFAECSHRVAEAYGALVPGAAAQIAPMRKAKVQPTRDYISFDEAEERNWLQQQKAGIGEARRVA